MALHTWMVLALLEFLVLGALTTQLVRFYASKSSPFYSLLTVFIGWYLGFFGTLFLPIDIAEAYASLTLTTENVTERVPLSIPTPTPTWGWAGNGTINGTGTGNNGTMGTWSPMPAASASANFTSTATCTGTATVSSAASVNVKTTGNASASWTVPPEVTASMAAPTSQTPTGTPTYTSSSSTSVASTPTSTGTATGTPSAGGPASATPAYSASHSRTSKPTATQSPTPSLSTGASPSTTPSVSNEARLLRYSEDERRNGPGQGRRVQGVASASPVDYAPTQAPVPSGTLIPIPVANASAFPTPGGDNSTVIYVQEVVEIQVRNGPLEAMWFFVYWATFIMTYAVIPVVQEYVAAGQFSKRGRLIEAVKINLVFYAACMVAAFGALAYVVFGLGQTLWDLLPVLTSLANTLGLVIIVPLLGYGTAEVPRALWRHADAEGELRRLYFRAPELDSSLFDSKGALGDIVKEIAEFGSKLTAMGADKEYSDGAKAVKVKELQRCYGIVLRKVAYARELLGPSFGQEANKNAGPPSAARKKAMEQSIDDEEEDEKSDKGYFASMGKMFSGNTHKYKGINPGRLAKLHKKVMAMVFKVKKTSYRWESLITRCIELEYIAAGTVPPVPTKRKTAEGQTYYTVPAVDAVGVRGEAKGGRPGNLVPRGGVASSTRSGDRDKEEGVDKLSEKAADALMSMMLCPTVGGGCFNTLQWRFNIHARPLFFRVVAVLAEIMSILLLWSEATIWINLQGLVPQNLSVFGMALRLADERGGEARYALIQIAAFIPLAYMCACTTFTVFQLKLFDMLDLSGGQNTDPYSLLVNASLFNRLQFSLAFNFLNVLMHSNNRLEFPDTAFLHSVGAKMSLSIIDWYLPVLIVVIYAACKCNVFDRIMKYVFGIEDKGDPIKGDIDDEVLVREGAIVVARGRRNLGLGGGSDTGASEADRRKHEDLSRNRIALVMARAQARREGRNPDEVGRLDGGSAGGSSSSARGQGMEGDEELGGDPSSGSGGGGAGYASGGAFLFSTQGMFKMDQFSAAPVGEGAGAGTGVPHTGLSAALGSGLGKLGLADLARKAKLDKLGSAFGKQPAEPVAPGDMHGADGSHGAARHDGVGGYSEPTQEGLPRRTNSSRGRLHTGGSPPAVQAVETLPTLAQILRGKKAGDPPNIGLPRVPEGQTGYGLAAAANAQAASRQLAFDFVPGGGQGDPFKTPGRKNAGLGRL